MKVKQYVPKGFNINTISIQYLACIQNKLLVDQEKNNV